MPKIIAVNECHGFQGRYWVKGQEGNATEAELKDLAAKRKLSADALIPPPHFRFADEKLNAAAAAALAKSKAKPEPKEKPEEKKEQGKK